MGALVAVLAVAGAGCVFPSCHSDMLVEGTGYDIVKIAFWNFTAQKLLVDADLSPDGHTFALLANNATLEFWTTDGDRIRTIDLTVTGLTTDGVTCNRAGAVRFLHATAVVVSCETGLRAFSLLGTPLWGTDVTRGINGPDMAVAAGGTQVLVGNRTGQARLWDVESRNQTILANLSAPAIEVDASADGQTIGSRGIDVWVASASGSLKFHSPYGLMGMSGFELSGDGSEAFSFETSNTSGLNGAVLVFSNRSATGEPERISVAKPGLRGPGSLVAVSPSGRFVAIATTILLSHIDVLSSENVILVVDRQAPATEIGFHVYRDARVFLRDDGSALALSDTPAGFHLTRATPNATLPTKVPAPGESHC